MLKANKKRDLIRQNFSESIRPCNHCNGTGLDNIASLEGDYAWDGSSFCDHCEGIGYLSWKETMTKKLCPRCKGYGKIGNTPCSGCHGEGLVDWLRYMMIGGSKEK